MFNYFFLFGFLFLANLSFADDTVRISDLDDPIIYASNSLSAASLMLIDLPTSGEGNTESSPFEVYIPLGGNGADDQHLNTIIENPNEDPILSPAFLPEIPLDTTSNSFIQVYTLLTNESTNTLYLNIAIEDEDEDEEDEKFKIFSLSTSVSIAASSAEYSYASFNLGDMCENIDCSKIQTTAGENDDDFLVYLFLDDDQNAVGTSVTTSENGIFVKLSISDELPEGVLTIDDDLVKGDGRLFVEFSGGEDITQVGDDFYRTIIFKYDDSITTEQSEASINTYSLGEKWSIEDESLSGSLYIKGLTNNTQYNFSLGIVNKYQFSSLLSSSKLGTPENIDAFLETHACYLVSAGFKTEHFVLDYFRFIRDHYLINNIVGQQFIDFYYKTAPKYAKIVYHNEYLSFAIRIISYFIYYLLNNIYLFISIGFAISGICLFRMKSSNKLP
ncbi:MAG: hypothetical protein HOJ35_09760, partial [Bdellovibrionales bacterium]|nr:hypothetical protein [Bdellovibrionales bacterium]